MEDQEVTSAGGIGAGCGIVIIVLLVIGAILILTGYGKIGLLVILYTYLSGR